MTAELGKLTSVDPREVWKHEAHDFTPWLLANADALGDPAIDDHARDRAAADVCGVRCGGQRERRTSSRVAHFGQGEPDSTELNSVRLPSDHSA